MCWVYQAHQAGLYRTNDASSNVSASYDYTNYLIFHSLKDWQAIPINFFATLKRVKTLQKAGLARWGTGEMADNQRTEDVWLGVRRKVNVKLRQVGDNDG